jgi:hypothetical protein
MTWPRVRGFPFLHDAKDLVLVLQQQSTSRDSFILGAKEVFESRDCSFVFNRDNTELRLRIGARENFIYPDAEHD